MKKWKERELYEAIAEVQENFGLVAIHIDPFKYRLWSEARDQEERRKASDLAQKTLCQKGWRVLPDAADVANCDFFVSGPA